MHICTDLSFRLHRRRVGYVDVLLCELWHGQQQSVSLGVVCSKRRRCAMPGSQRSAGLRYFQLPNRLFDGHLASLELLLGHLWDWSSATDP